MFFEVFLTYSLRVIIGLMGAVDKGAVDKPVHLGVVYYRREYKIEANRLLVNAKEQDREKKMRKMLPDV